MTKQELLETYTAEQLAEMVIELQSRKERKVFKVSDNKNYQKELEEFLKESPIQSTIERICRDITDQKNNAMAMEFTRVICELLRENGVYVHCTETKFSENVTHNYIEEKYGIKFDSVDFSEHDKEFVDKIEELQSEVEKYRKAFEDAKKERDCQIAEYQKKIEELTDEKESLEMRLKLLKSERDDLREEVEKLKKAQDFSNLTPIEVANMLINAEGEYEHNPIAKVFCKEDKSTYRIFDISDLRQIAEHLLVYCNHNGEAEE